MLKTKNNIQITEQKERKGLQGILRMNAPQNDVGAAIHSTKRLQLVPYTCNIMRLNHCHFICH